MAIKYRTKPGKAVEVNWADIREEYIEQNLSVDHRWSLRQVAELYGLNYGTVRNKAADEGWNQQLENRRVSSRVTALEALREAKGIFNEIEVRVRQARFGRDMTTKGMQKLANVDPEKLTIPQAIEMARVGMDQERRALGMPDRYEFIGIPGTEERDQHLHALDELIGVLERKANIIEGEAKEIVDDSGETVRVFEIEPTGNAGSDSSDAQAGEGDSGTD
jgi:hypothetical protein